MTNTNEDEAYLDVYKDRVVQFEIGMNKDLYHVHIGVVTKHSTVLAAAFRTNENGSGFKEAMENAMSLPDESSEVFKLFVHWLYTGKCPKENKLKDHDINSVTIRLVTLYIFGDKYDVPKLRAEVFRELINVSLRYPFPSFTVGTLVYRLTPAGSPLRELISTTFATHVKPAWFGPPSRFESVLGEYPELMLDMLQVVVARGIPSQAEREKLIKDLAQEVPLM